MRALAPTTPTYIFPAMNTLMYEHPLTAEHLRIVRDVVRYNVVGPIGKGLACGDVGKFIAFIVHRLTMCASTLNLNPSGLGAMTEWRDIVKTVVEHFHLVPKAQ